MLVRGVARRVHDDAKACIVGAAAEVGRETSDAGPEAVGFS